jgi:glycosyltransferase involved in cell wall biosynthesis
MRIAVIHSFYRSAVSSGENNTVLAQVEALKEAGHEVRLFAQYTDLNQKTNPLYPLKAGFDVATGNGYDPTKELLEFGPDVVRVHNLFPNFSTKWLSSWQGPVMATLHNFRPVCVNGVLFRDGKVCTLCPDGKPLSGIKYGCYRESRLASIPLTIQNAKGLGANPLLSRADKIIVLSKRSFDAYARFGLDPARMVVIPNFVKGFKTNFPPLPKNNRWVVAARLSPEKGVRELVEQWPDGYHLDIYGDGEERKAIAAMNKPNVLLKGMIPHKELARLLPSYAGMVFPSLVWENVPGAVLMAFDSGIPVVALEGSVGADLVLETGAGLVYSDNMASGFSILESCLKDSLKVNPEIMQSARQLFQQELWLKHTMQQVLEIAHINCA